MTSKTEDAAKLQACPNPWCAPSPGLPPILRWTGMNAVLVECASCGMEGPSFGPVEFDDDGEEIGSVDAEAKAIAAWNLRTPAPTADVLEDAARVAEDFQGSAFLERCDDPCSAIGQEIAAAIRALKQHPEPK